MIIGGWGCYKQKTSNEVCQYNRKDEKKKN